MLDSKIDVTFNRKAHPVEFCKTQFESFNLFDNGTDLCIILLYTKEAWGKRVNGANLINDLV